MAKYRDEAWLREQYYSRERDLSDIAEECGVWESTISKWRKKLDIPKPDAKSASGMEKYRDRDWLFEQYVEKGRSITDIAAELGCDHTTISKWRRKLDIPKDRPAEDISDTTDETRHRNNATVVELECPVCGSEFTRRQSEVEDAKYTNVCSRECIYEARSMGIIGREVDGGYESWATTYEKECVSCGEEFTVKAVNKDQRHCSRECFESAHSERMAGEENPAYIDGSSYEKRSHRGPHWEQERMLAYERDDYTCRRCGEKCISRTNYDGSNGGRIIQAHHINAYESPDDNSLDNLVTLCAKCHGEVEGGEPLDID